MKVTRKRVLSTIAAAAFALVMMSIEICAQTFVSSVPIGIVAAETNKESIDPPTKFKVSTDAYSVDISWEPVEGAEIYTIYQYNERTEEYEHIGFAYWPKYTVDGLEKNTSYKFRIRSGKGFTISKKSKVITVKTSIISTPTISNSGYGNEKTFSWNSINGADHYNVYRYNSKTKKFSLIAKTTDTSYSDPKAKRGQTYSYKVAAVCEEGRGSLSEEYKTTIPELDAPAISADFDGKSVHISWDDISKAQSYNVYRYNTKTKKYKLIKETSWNWYYDEKIKPDNKYTYKVCAVDSFGKGEYSNIVSVKVPEIKLPSAPVITKTEAGTYSVKFSWNDVKGANEYKIYQYNPNTKKYELFDTTLSTSVTINFLSSDTTYYFKVAAKNLKGTGAFSKQIKITTNKKASTSSDHSLTWVCPACGTTNFDFGGLSFACTNCKNMKPTNNTWTCPRCGTTNFNFGLGICSSCGNLKP
ncbi:MAG: fibronectin type III domain-containing protein [Oscillospiraceae bacterium]